MTSTGGDQVVAGSGRWPTGLGMGALLAVALLLGGCATALRGTSDMGIVVERATGSVLVFETSGPSVLGRVDGLGDLSHASAVYSRDGRYAFVFGRDGGLSKVDLLRQMVVARTVQAGNSIGGAISQDGRLVAVSNYEPGGVRVFDAETLEPVADIPAQAPGGRRSKTVGLVDAPGDRFVFSLFDAGEIWTVDMSDPDQPDVEAYPDVGRQPYDAMITPDGRFYVAGLFGEDGAALLDLWHPEQGVRRVLPHYGRGEERLPVYKMPHMESWAVAGDRIFLPAVGHHSLLVMDRQSWTLVDEIPLAGQPVFAVARPDGRQLWVNFALPDNDAVQIVDTETLQVVQTLRPGPGVLHLEFTPRGEQLWLSVRDADRVDVYDTRNVERIASFRAQKPSGIFLSARSARTGL